jgi:hypothetical protein
MTVAGGARSRDLRHLPPQAPSTALAAYLSRVTARLLLLLLLSLAGCTPGEPTLPYLGTWEILEASGRTSDTFVSGRTLQLLEANRAVISGPGFETVQKRFEAVRGYSIGGEEGVMLVFEGDQAAFLVKLPTRTEMLLEENDFQAILLRLRRSR